MNILAFLRPGAPLPHVVVDTPTRAPNGQFSPSPKTKDMRSRKEQTTAALRRYVTEQQLLQAVERAVRG